MLRSRRRLVVLAIVLVAALGAYLTARRVLGSDVVRTTLEQQLSAAFGQPVRIASASASMFPRVSLNLHEITIGSPVAIQINQLRIATGLRPLFSRRVEEAEVVVSGGTVLLPLAFGLPPESGRHEGKVEGAGLTVASVRLIDVRGVSFIAGKDTFVVDADSSIEGDRLEIRSLAAGARATRLTASGSLTSVAKLQGQLTATADRLDLDELLSFASALTATGSAPASSAKPAGDTHLRISLTASQGQFATHPFRDLKTDIDIVPGHVKFAPLAVSAFGGKFQGDLDVDAARAAPDLRLTGRIEGLDVAEIMKASGSAGGLTGRLGGTITVTGTGTDSDVLMRTARGTIAAAVTDGAMPHLDMVRTIVLAFGKPSGAPPPGSGSAFSRLSGTFALADGAVSSQDIAMAARDFDMAGSGTLQIPTGAIAARGDVILSKELTSQAGVDLRRYAQEDGRVIVPTVISGTLQRPGVTLDLVAATRRALGNELQRRVKSFMNDLFKKK